MIYEDYKAGNISIEEIKNLYEIEGKWIRRWLKRREILV